MRTCLQSGNIIFEYPRASRVAVRQKIRTVFLERFAVESEFVLRTGLPFESTGERLTAVSTINREVFLVSRLKPNGFFGFPNNFIEDAFGVPATTRNWST